MAVAAILDFRNREILLAHGFQSAKTRHRCKLRQNWSVCSEDIAIYRFFNMTAAAILDFLN